MAPTADTDTLWPRANSRWWHLVYEKTICVMESSVATFTILYRRVPILLTISVLPFLMKTLYIYIYVYIYIYICVCVCVCVCVICGKVFRGGVSWFLFGASMMWGTVLPLQPSSHVQAHMVYMRGRKSSVNVRTTHKPERLAQYRASAAAW